MTQKLSPAFSSLAAGVVPVAAAAALAWFAVTGSAGTRSPYPTRLLPIDTTSANQLQALFSAFDYQWPPADEIPPLGLSHLPENLGALEPDVKKRLFLRAILPLVLAANNRIRAERHYVRQALARGGPPSARLMRLAAKYRVTGDLSDRSTRRALLRRCDTVPAGLVLAQAAKESGWGTSTFAVDANNLFGVWTWRAGAGVTPSRRTDGSHHLVRAYPNLRASVRDYLYNLNVGHAYAAFRRVRARARAAGRDPDPTTLARTLEDYSQRRGVYTRRLERLIQQNQLVGLSLRHLVPLAAIAAAGRGNVQGSSARLKSQ